MYTFFFSYYLPSCSVQEIGSCSLCCTAGPHCLSVLSIIVLSYHHNLPVHPIPFSFPSAAPSLFCFHVCESASVL